MITQKNFFDTLMYLHKDIETCEFACVIEKIIDKLDELDCDDVFGQEGWIQYFGLEE